MIRLAAVGLFTAWGAGVCAQGSPLPAGETPHATPAAGRAALPRSDASWQLQSTEAYPGKQDDIFFVDAANGWYANGAGKIFKTTDGGATWTEQLRKPGTYFRCLGFIDPSTGFVGNIGPGYFPNVTDTVPLYATRDGGKTWTPAEGIEGPPVVGLCAIDIVRTPFVNAGNLDYKVRVVAVGRVGGPGAMIVSDDNGASWQPRTLPPSAAMAFDVHFFDAKHGVVAAATSPDVAEARPLLISTADGGEIWAESYTGTRPFELTWKLSFPTRDIGYATIQSYNPDPGASARYIAKTLDGGRTWTEIPLVNDHRVRPFGIAFVDANRGWVGAMPGGFETRDGGKTWLQSDMGNAVNKIRVVKDGNRTRLHAIGVDVRTLALEAAPPSPAAAK